MAETTDPNRSRIQSQLDARRLVPIPMGVHRLDIAARNLV